MGSIARDAFEMKGKGRRTTIAAAILAMGVIAAAAWSFRGLATERWLIWRLGGRDSEAVRSAAEGLAARGSVRAIPAFLDLFRKQKAQDPRTVIAFGQCLDRAGPRSAPALEEGLGSPGIDDDLAILLAGKLLAHRPGSPTAAGTLLRIIERSPADRARRALDSLLKKGLDPLPALTARAAGPTPADRTWALQEIAALGPGASAAFPVVSAALLDPFPVVRLRAARALLEMKSSDARILPVLDDGLRSDDAEARFLAIDLFTRLGPLAAGRLPAAAAALTNLAPGTRRAALDTLGPRRGPLLDRIGTLDPPPAWLLDEVRRNPYDAGTER